MRIRISVRCYTLRSGIKFEMVVKIRLARLGCRNHPFYRVVVADSKTTRDGKQLEVLGFYNPVAGKDDDKRMRLKLERIKYWLSVGANPSEPVERLLFRAGFGRQDGPSHKSPIAALNGHILNHEQPENADHNKDNGISPEAIFSIGLQV